MAKLGTPAIPSLRTNDLKSLQNAFNAVAERLRVLEALLGSDGTTSLLQGLNTQDDGLVVKSTGRLVTRKLVEAGGVTITNPTGQTGNPSISAP